MIFLSNFNIILCVFVVYSKGKSYDVEHRWNLFSYDIDGVKYTSDSDFEFKIGTISFPDDVLVEHEKFLIRKNLVPYHVTFNYEKYLVSIPRTRPGIPFTINVMETFNLFKDNNSPMLKPFPSSKESRNIISVYETAEDGCERYWFVDTGFIDVPGARRQVIPPSIQAYTQLDNKVLYRIDIDSNVLRDGVSSGLRSLTVDYIFPCTKAFVYIGDDNGNAIIAFSFEEKRFWRIERQTAGGEAWTFPVPQSIIYYVQNVIRYRHSPNETFIRYSNIVKTTPISQQMERDTSVDLSERDANPRGVLYDRNYESNILFFTNELRTKIYCWNMDTPMVKNNIDLLFNLDKKYYISAMNTVGSSFYIMVNRIRGYNNDDIYNENNVNFADYTMSVDYLLENSQCARPTHCTTFVKDWMSKVQGSVGASKYLTKYVPNEYIDAVFKDDSIDD